MGRNDDVFFCVVEMLFVKNTKIVILAGSAALLYKAIFSCVRTGNRPKSESAVNNGIEWTCFKSFSSLFMMKKADFWNY